MEQNRTFRLTPSRRCRNWVAGLALLVFLAFVAWLVYPGGGHPRENARRMNCASNLRQIGLALTVYAQNNDEAFPPNFDVLYPDDEGYLDNARVFSCPSHPSEWQKIEETGEVRSEWTSYVYVAGLTNEDDAACVLAYDRFENHAEDGVNVLFLDTHVEWTPDLEKLAELLAKTRSLAAANGHAVKLVGE